MTRFGRRRIRPDGRGGFSVRLTAPERTLLEHLPSQLDGLLAATGADGGLGDELPPPVARLLPAAYPRDEQADAAYATATRAALVATHRRDLAALANVARHQAATTAEELDAACAAIGDLRLVLGTSLGVTEDPGTVGDDDPEYPKWIAYGFLSGLQAEIVDVLSGYLPPPSPGADDDAPPDPWGEPVGGLRWDGTPRPEG